ncbi:RHS repeat-associated core domain-containing protein, partial [Salmonella enterica]|uniref:RHS repeat-associated core domain-containing protein n=1 Tax=Salmonella enterica TaxID=28901 RepID=UPI0039C33261
LSGEENPEHLEQVIRLPGQQYDEESGLYYNRHRYYNPGQGRYITQDPIGLAGGLNPYTYPLNPTTDTDPLGLIAPVLVGVACGFALDYLLDEWKKIHCNTDTIENSPFRKTGNVATGAAAGLFGGFETKPRTGIAGGGPSGSATSVYSKAFHYLYNKGIITKKTTHVFRAYGRKIVKKIPYVGAVMSMWDIYDASTCDD